MVSKKIVNLHGQFTTTSFRVSLELKVAYRVEPKDSTLFLTICYLVLIPKCMHLKPILLSDKCIGKMIRDENLLLSEEEARIFAKLL